MRGDSRAARGAAVDFVPMWMLSCCVAVSLVLGILGAVYAPQRAITMWNYASAADCPAGAPAADCLATLPGTVGSVAAAGGTRNDTAKAVIHVDVPDAPPGTTRFSDGTVLVQVTPGEAEELGITGDGAEVEVALFDGNAIAITGPSGRTVTAQDPPAADFLGTFLLLVGFGLLTAGGVGYGWRRLRTFGWSWRVRYGTEDRRVEMPRWIRPVWLGVGGAAVAGALVGWLASLAGDVWLVPVTLGVTLLGSIALVLSRRLLTR